MRNNEVFSTTNSIFESIYHRFSDEQKRELHRLEQIEQCAINCMTPSMEGRNSPVDSVGVALLYFAYHESSGSQPEANFLFDIASFQESIVKMKRHLPVHKNLM